jgi:hypothetical protein
MRASELTKTLATLIEAGEPALIKGPPGAGKTDIVKHAAKAADAICLVIHPVVSDPTDIKGLPAIVDGRALFLPFGELDQLIKAKKSTVAFLDDLGQAPLSVQAAYMHPILARHINGHNISEHVTWIATTNPKSFGMGVNGILEPVKSRFTTILELEVNVEDWCAWALANNVPPELVAFIRFRPGLLLDSGKPTADIVNRPCPRTLASLGRLHKLGITGVEALGGAVGEGAATEFVAFLRIWQALPSVEGILANPDKAQAPSDPAALYAISTALSSRIEKANAGKIIKYLNRLPDEYSVLGVRDCLRALPSVASTPEFIKWAAEHSGILS